MLSGPPPIVGVAIGTAGFAGAGDGGLIAPALVTSIADLASLSGAAPPTLERMVRGFFANGGARAWVADDIADLEQIDEVELLCPLPAANAVAIAQCERRRDRVALLSLPAGLTNVADVLAARPAAASAYAAAHHPWLRAAGEWTPPGGHVAGLYAAGDMARAPSGIPLRGLDAPPVERAVTPAESEALVAGGVNPLRDFGAAGGVRLWGARTLHPDPELRYLPVQRLRTFLEQSIGRGVRWGAFEPNGEALWTRVRDHVGAFLLDQWRAERLRGRTPAEAFFVRCDRTTMTEDDLAAGRLVCLIGVAPLRPAEFVLFRIGAFTADAGG
jgi:phage tail sheath protein FI